MQKAPFARDVLRDVTAGLQHAVTVARRAGVAKSQIVLDPGIGFGKSYEQNCELLARLPELARLGYPLLVGTSRKSFISKVLEKGELHAGSSVDRIWGTAATVAASILRWRTHRSCARCGGNGTGGASVGRGGMSAIAASRVSAGDSARATLRGPTETRVELLGSES